MLQSLPYHQKVREHFKSQPNTWDYFTEEKNKEGHLDLFKSEL